MKPKGSLGGIYFSKLSQFICTRFPVKIAATIIWRIVNMDMIDLSNINLELGLQIALIIVGLLIGIVAIVSLTVSLWLMVKYTKFNCKKNSAGLTGEEVARRILDAHGLQHIKVKVTGSILFGNSYSHFFKKVRLRRLTRHKTSITALGMGAQKASLAILDKEDDRICKNGSGSTPLSPLAPLPLFPCSLLVYCWT